MRMILAALTMVMASSEAYAISRYQSTSMSCGQVRAALQREGAAILRWQSKRVAGLPLYNRYVANSRFCRSDERAVTATVPTRDDDACWVRKCERIERKRRPWLLFDD